MWMTGDIEIVEAGLSEASAIVRVFQKTRSHDLPYLPSLHSHEEELRFQEALFAKGQVMVAVQADKIVAFCAFREGWVDHLYVLPEAQGNGIGTALLQRAMNAFAELQLWVFQRNEGARRFYENRGFRFVELTSGTGNMEKEPDVRYIWSRG
jgi:GNAT superfamily N-acetyltransferase